MDLLKNINKSIERSHLYRLKRILTESFSIDFACKDFFFFFLLMSTLHNCHRRTHDMIFKLIIQTYIDVYMCIYTQNIRIKVEFLR